MKLEDMLDECTKVDEKERFTGHSCLLVTWKTNPEVEKFKVGWKKKKSLFSEGKLFLSIK